MPERRRFLFFAITRLVVVCIIFAASTFLFIQNNSLLITGKSYYGIFWITLITAVLTLLISLLARKSTLKTTTLSYLQIIWDIHYVTFLIILTGGGLSPYPFLYLIVIIAASISLSRRESIMTACCCIIFYGGIVNLHFYGYLNKLGLYPSDFGETDTKQVVYSIFLSTFSYLLAAVLTGYLSARVREGEKALEKREIDYSELKNLHDTIIRTIDSGFITLTLKGRIRVFNSYAETILGISLKDAYDRRLSELLPEFTQKTEGEILLPENNGKRKIIGYKSLPLKDDENTVYGTIYHFKDLTELADLREKLKKADRLAALGEMAARMAHEIRNPLASISGSAQLLSDGRIAPEDRKLLGIVQRESERLNALLTEFLEYTKPHRVSLDVVNLADLLEEIKLQLINDARFSEIKVIVDADTGVKSKADINLLRQALLNLIVNSAEASPSGSTITLSAKRGECSSLISVADQGGGISQKVIEHLYEPFFTTKPGGTGLGLAMVHRIIDAHNGVMQLETDIGSGTKFTLVIPDDLHPGIQAD